MTGSSRPLAGRVAVVTGAGKGLGRAFAVHLADLGAAVVVNNRNREVDENGHGSADRVVAEVRSSGGQAVADYGDVSIPETGQALVARALESFGRLDICVTSAAVSRPQLLHKTSAESFKAVLDVNVTGTVMVLAAASAAMREAGHGRIVAVASTAGLHGEPTISAYAASKGAVIAAARTAAVEGAPKGVSTNVVLPYATTQMTEQGMDPQYADRMRCDLVAPVVGALADPRCELNGQVLVTGGGGLRTADAVEGGTVLLPGTDRLDPGDLSALVEESRGGDQRTFATAQDAFRSLAADVTGERG